MAIGGTNWEARPAWNQGRVSRYHVQRLGSSGFHEPCPTSKRLHRILNGAARRCKLGIHHSDVKPVGDAADLSYIACCQRKQALGESKRQHLCWVMNKLLAQHRSTKPTVPAACFPQTAAGLKVPSGSTTWRKRGNVGTTRPGHMLPIQT